MTSVDLVDAILARMAADDVSRSALARACGLSQPHISRVLNKQLKPGPKTLAKLARWLNGAGALAPLEGPAPSIADLQQLVKRMGGKSPERRMQIMHFLRLLDAMTGGG
ncbi:helix-turn-helix domain-containing protein [Caulobacter radicis]|nr:helix-turn-helix transcriptional regulator [Caulobacter radicis]